MASPAGAHPRADATISANATTAGGTRARIVGPRVRSPGEVLVRLSSGLAPGTRPLSQRARAIIAAARGATNVFRVDRFPSAGMTSFAAVNLVIPALGQDDECGHVPTAARLVTRLFSKGFGLRRGYITHARK